MDDCPLCNGTGKLRIAVIDPAIPAALYKATSVTLSQVVGRGNAAHISDARKMLSVMLRNRFRFTLVSIGKLIERDHTTIIHLIKSHDSLYAYDSVYKFNYDQFTAEIERAAPNIKHGAMQVHAQYIRYVKPPDAQPDSVDSNLSNALVGATSYSYEDILNMSKAVRLQTAHAMLTAVLRYVYHYSIDDVGRLVNRSKRAVPEVLKRHERCMLRDADYRKSYNELLRSIEEVKQ